MELTHSEKQTLVLALGRAIEHEARALESCIKDAHPNNRRAGEIDVAIKHRQRVMKELEQLRQRLIHVRP
jgi:hypothetical protein